MHDRLRARVAGTLKPVRPLRAPSTRALAVTPLAALLLVAAPLVFTFRDLAALGWTWSWGASLAQALAGLALIAIALRESVPGRSVSAGLVAAISTGFVLTFAATTAASWEANPVRLAQHWRLIGAVCLASSATTALPAIALSAVLIVRAFPLRPGFAGSVAGFGSGVLADAGWRLFCHYSEPGHVIAAHFGAIACASLAGAVITTWLAPRAGRG